ncbi:MAG: (Fe-S)-binding protein [Gammaproteobacteria bacterium]
MRVALFVTCLVDLYRPRVGFAAVRLLEQAGCQVEVPVQTCCGQPAYNNGDLDNARAIARQVIEAFSGYAYVVAPSGSCAGMLKCHYPTLFADDAEWRERAQDLAARTHELLSFLHDTLDVCDFGATCTESATYHDSCSSLRELGVRTQPRRLLARVAGLQLEELADTQVCCGFGGTFCVKYPELSTRMVDDKARAVIATGADLLLAADLGCLLNIAGRLGRLDSPVRVYHIAEVLAGMADDAGIGGGEP